MSATMKALVLHGIGDLRLETLPIPEIGPGDVLVRVAWCGVCGSDIPRIFRTGAHRHPVVPGHEMAGVVAAVGAEVRTVQPGTPVVVFPLIWCGRCAACEVGRYAQCANYDYRGSRSDGGFAEFVAVPEANVRPVPDGVPLDAAAMCEPAAVAVHALRRSPVPPAGQTVVVFGAGPIGILVGQWARILGATQVLLFDPVAYRLEVAQASGLKSAYDPSQKPPREVIGDLTDGHGASVCIDAAGVPATVVEACESVARGGAVVLLGNPSADVMLPKATVSRVLRMEASLVGVWNSTYAVHAPDDDWSMALNAMASGALDAGSLISDRVGLAEAVALLAQVKDGVRPAMKVLIGEAAAGAGGG
jgi:L-iditol 2-dehydrogenase